jgi:uncharacterized metal-binding protein
MASGKNHDKSIYFATPVVGILSGYYLTPMLGLIAASSHLLGGLYLSPDLDLKSLPWKRWGLLKSIWLPYQKFIPHRHWLSHAPVVGSIGRLLYLGLWLSPVAIALIRALPPLQLGKEFWHSVAAALAGVEVSALNHLLLDGLLIPLPKGIKARLKGD